MAADHMRISRLSDRIEAKMTVPPDEKVRKDSRRRKAKELLGGKCALCGETDLEILEFDHIVPYQPRERTGVTITRILKGDTDNVQLLCANCHLRKSKTERRNGTWAKYKKANDKSD